MSNDRLASQLADLRRRTAECLARLSDPRAINPIYVFAAGLSVMLPLWLLFLNR
jgi:hypothetical protein